MRGRLGQVLYAKSHRNRMKNRMCKRALTSVLSLRRTAFLQPAPEFCSVDTGLARRDRLRESHHQRQARVAVPFVCRMTGTSWAGRWTARSGCGISPTRKSRSGTKWREPVSGVHVVATGNAEPGIGRKSATQRLVVSEHSQRRCRLTYTLWGGPPPWLLAFSERLNESFQQETIW